MGTAFTYQGRLTLGGSPANGAYDFEFRLFDAATAGNQVGSAVPKNDLAVNDGYFTTTLDFGTGVFTGDARWLQIAVRLGAETGAYTTLSPRHELTPTPYTLYTSVAGSADYVPKFTSTGLTNSMLFESDSKIGIGTVTPQKKLEVAIPDNDLISFGTYLTSLNHYCGVHFGYREAGNPNYRKTALAFEMTDGTYARGKIHLLNNGAASNASAALADAKLTVDYSGKVGIGTTSPTSKLDIYNPSSSGSPVLTLHDDNPYQMTLGINYLRASQSFYIEAYRAGSAGITFRTSNTSPLDTVAMTIPGNGKVGIGTTTPTEKLDVNGTVRCVSLVQTSDERLKTDIQPLDGVLDKLSRVRAVSFQWNEKAQALGAKTGVRQIGVLAQEVEQAFPELVTIPETIPVDKLPQKCTAESSAAEVQQHGGVGNAPYQAVNYSELTAVLLEAVKELRQENAAFRVEVERRLDQLEKSLPQRIAEQPLCGIARGVR